jgi:hypothetical protein
VAGGRSYGGGRRDTTKNGEGVCFTPREPRAVSARKLLNTLEDLDECERVNRAAKDHPKALLQCRKTVSVKICLRLDELRTTVAASIKHHGVSEFLPTGEYLRLSSADRRSRL